MGELTFITDSAGETFDLGRRLGESLTGGEVLLLTGELGSGKTCFAQGLARGLGVPSEEPVVSPSYTLMNLYRGRLELYHFDLYRLVNPDDLEDLGFYEYAEGEGVTVVEWADRFAGLDLEGIRIRMERIDENTRRLTIGALGPAARRAVRDLLQKRNEGGGQDDRV